MIVHEHLEQGSEEWLRARLGCATASMASSVITPTGKLSASRIGYARKLARQCSIADTFPFEGNKYTEWGHQHEPAARAYFEQETGIKVSEVGFCTREDKIIGCSPDGLIKGEDGEWIAGLEIKAPQIDQHGEYLIAETLPSTYKPQVHWSLATTGLKKWWFVSYHPQPENSPLELKQLIVEVHADEYTERVREAQDAFLDTFKQQYDLVMEKLYVGGGAK